MASPASVAPLDASAIMTPFDAEAFLAQHPEQAAAHPELVALRNQREHYLLHCCGLFKETVKAALLLRFETLNELVPYADASDDTKKQFQSAIEYIYTHALKKGVVPLLEWLDARKVLFNIKSLATDVASVKNPELHAWFAKRFVDMKREEHAGKFLLSSGSIAEALDDKGAPRGGGGAGGKPSV